LCLPDADDGATTRVLRAGFAERGHGHHAGIIAQVVIRAATARLLWIAASREWSPSRRRVSANVTSRIALAIATPIAMTR
jgi:hypothetical protein